MEKIEEKQNKGEVREVEKRGIKEIK